MTTYNAQETEEGKWIALAIGQIEKPLEGPVFLDCLFVMPIPKSATKKQRSAMQAGEIKHVKKPDLDNLVKFCKDCLNEIAWRDDSQVVQLAAVKQYGAEPCSWIWIREV